MLLLFNNEDSLAMFLTHFMLVNCLFTQVFKRFIFRKRPFAFQPPRAFSVVGPRSSSLPSRAVVLASSMIFALTLEQTYNVWTAIGASLGTYLCLFFARVHLGGAYPSDCILSFPLAIINILLGLLVDYIFR